MQINDLEYDRTSKIQTQKIEKNIDVLIFFAKSWIVQWKKRKLNIEKVIMAGSIFNVKTFTAAVCLPLSAAIIGTSFRYFDFNLPSPVLESVMHISISLWTGFNYWIYLLFCDLTFLAFSLWNFNDLSYTSAYDD